MNNFIIENNKLIKYTGKESTVIVPQGVEIIEKDVFAYNNKIKTVVVPDTVKEIEEYAFAFCKNLETVVLSEGLEKIGREAFTCSMKLFSIDIPDSVVEIGSEAFSNIKPDKDSFVIKRDVVYNYFGEDEVVVIPDGIKKIERHAFRFCDMKKVVLPEGLVEIGAGAFDECMNLEEINIPDSVEFIGDEAFIMCESLKKIKIPGSAKVYDTAFLGCEDLVVESDKNFRFIKSDDTLSMFYEENNETADEVEALLQAEFDI